MEYRLPDEIKFQEYCATCEIIQKLLGKEIRDSFGSLKNASQKLAKVADMSDTNARKFIGEYCGTLVTKITPGSRGKTDLYLERLAKLYNLLDIGPEEDIVELTRKVNPLFKYP